MIADLERERTNLAALRAAITANMSQLVETMNTASQLADQLIAAQIRACRQTQTLIELARSGEIGGEAIEAPRVTDAQLLQAAHNVVALRPGMTARNNGTD